MKQVFLACGPIAIPVKVGIENELATPTLPDILRSTLYMVNLLELSYLGLVDMPQKLPVYGAVFTLVA